ncbi:DUF1906 domain-containing protein [Massilia consociata]|uniref:DUF1906 domain-containing protein n=1 Tax=Massilia consociata TaxID=760117 RepID=A0ABV6FGN4_9BURK
MAEITSPGFDTALQMTRHAAALRQQGYDFVMRYYSHNAAKNLTPEEARALAAAGLRLGAVWESAGTHTGFFSGAQGRSDGTAALSLARAVGQPAGSAIYFAVDFDPSQADIDGPVADYFAGVAAALGSAYRIGVYGSGLCCGSLLDRAQADCCWLSQSTGFAGSKAFAQARRYDLIQALPKRIVLDGCTLDIDPDSTNPAGNPGLFRPGEPG